MGGLVEGSIQKVDKNGSDVEALDNTRVIAPQGIQWHVFAAFRESDKLSRINMYIRKVVDLISTCVCGYFFFSLFLYRTPLILKVTDHIAAGRRNHLT